jgi:hypothetical protein
MLEHERMDEATRPLDSRLRIVPATVDNIVGADAMPRRINI